MDHSDAGILSGPSDALAELTDHALVLREPGAERLVTAVGLLDDPVHAAGSLAVGSGRNGAWIQRNA